MSISYNDALINNWTCIFCAGFNREHPKIICPSHNSEDIIFRIGGTLIQRYNLSQLYHGNWLNDDIIDAYLQICNEKWNKSNSSKLFDSHAIRNNNSIPKLLFGNKKKESIAEYQKLIFPVNINNVHWVLIVILVNECQIKIIDSLACSEDVKSIAKGIQNALQHTKKTWPIVTIEGGQSNSSDCGVFVIKAAENEIKNSHETINQSDIKDIRKSICLELLKYKFKDNGINHILNTFYFIIKFYLEHLESDDNSVSIEYISGIML